MNVFVSSDACLQAGGENFPNTLFKYGQWLQNIYCIGWTKAGGPRLGAKWSSSVHTFTQMVYA
jgi:hypothetical protein